MVFPGVWVAEERTPYLAPWSPGVMPSSAFPTTCLCLLRTSKIAAFSNHGAVLAGTDNVLEAHGELPRPTEGFPTATVAAPPGLSREAPKSRVTQVWPHMIASLP